MEPFGLFQFLQSLLSLQGGNAPSSQGDEPFQKSCDSPSSPADSSSPTPTSANLSNPNPSANPPTEIRMANEQNPAARFLENHEKRARRKK